MPINATSTVFLVTFILCAAAGCQRQASSVSLGMVGLSKSATREANVGRPDRLTVLTFNMQHRDNPGELAVMAERLASDLSETPDFILCQEVLFQRSRHADEENTAAVLADELDSYWQGTKRTSDREGVAIISRYPFAYYAERHLKSQTNRLLLGFNRVSVMGEFMVPEVGRVRVVNVHFTNWGFEKRVRTNQLRETLEWMERREQEMPADLVILGGDFNAKPGSDELKLITEGHFAAVFNFQDFNTDDPTRGTKGRPRHRVDYIFVSAPDRGIRMIAEGEQRLWLEGLTSPMHRKPFWLSDHVPVLHEYVVEQTAVVRDDRRRLRDVVN